MLVELKARFDERNNIAWATPAGSGRHPRRLRPGQPEDALQAVPGRAQGSRRHPPLRAHRHRQLQPRRPSQIYTDLGLFTADAAIVDDVSRGVQLPDRLLEQARRTASCWSRRSACGSGFRALIEREMEHAQAGRPARIIIKNNAVADPGDDPGALSRVAGRRADRPDRARRLLPAARAFPGISETIRVRSIVGRFLEHSRIYYFENGGEPEVYIGSADLMERNLDRRVEVLCPVRDPDPDQHLRDVVLEALLQRHRSRLEPAARRRIRPRAARGRAGAGQLAAGAAGALRPGRTVTFTAAVSLPDAAGPRQRGAAARTRARTRGL